MALNYINDKSAVTQEAYAAIEALCRFTAPHVEERKIYESLIAQIADNTEVNQALIGQYFNECQQKDSHNIIKVDHGKYIPHIVINFCANAIRLDGQGDSYAVTCLTSAWYWLGHIAVLLNHHLINLDITERSKTHHKNHRSKNAFMQQVKGVEINPKNKLGLKKLDCFGEFNIDYTIDTLMKWYKEANPEFKARSGGDNRKSEQ